MGIKILNKKYMVDKFITFTIGRKAVAPGQKNSRITKFCLGQKYCREEEVNDCSLTNCLLNRFISAKYDSKV